MTRPKMFPDQFTNQRRLIWVKARSQANFRKEVWDLSFEDFCSFWSSEELWHKRGRGSADLVLSRINSRGPWSKSNCLIMTRHQQFINTAQRIVEERHNA